MRTRVSREVRWFSLLGLVALAAAPAPLAADDSDPTDVGLGSKVEELTRPEPEAPQDGVKVAVRVGEARFLRDLARVDVTLEATNTTGQQLEWERAFPMEASAEVIGCTLQRAGQAALIARTLTFEDGRRIYDETVRPPVPPPTGRDPLRVEREQDGRLHVTVFPVAPGETVRVTLSFALPLSGHARERRYLDPLWLDESIRRTRRGPVTLPREVGTLTSLLVEPGTLTYAAAESGLVAAGTQGTRMAFRPGPEESSGAQGKLVFHAPDESLPALSVPGGGLGTVVAFWRLDPQQLLAQHGLTARAGTQITLSAAGGLTQRVVPASLPADGDSVTVCARFSPQSSTLAYHVDVSTPDGPRRLRVELPVVRAGADEDLADAVTGFYRARLARHVLAWGKERGGAQQAAALAYAVDLGVIVPGTCALAIPLDEQQDLSRASRRTYRRDGAEVGAAGGEADWIAPPAGSIR